MPPRVRRAADFNSWEVVDHAADLFVDARLHEELITAFAADEREFVRRAAFAKHFSYITYQIIKIIAKDLRIAY